MSKLIFNKINDYIKQSQEELIELELYKLQKNISINLKKIKLFTKILELVGEKKDKYYKEFFNNYFKYYRNLKNIYEFIDIINKFMYNEELYNEIKIILDNIIIFYTPEPISKLINEPKSILKIKSKNKKKSISLVLRKKVWDKWIGLDIGKSKCLCCDITDIIQMSFHCGHIIAESKGGETNLSNLKPICQNCNLSMGSTNMNEFMKTLI
jgi:hypothetical protein